MNIVQVLKAEISRISKRESKALTSTTRSTAIVLKKTVADLKIRLAVLEKSNKELQKQVATLISSQPAPVEAPEGRAWISGKGVKALRRKLGLTQGELAKLTGVSTGAVVQWESKSGMLKLRDATKTSLMAIRGIGKTEARKRLAEMAPAKGKRAKVAKGKVRGKKASRRRK
jgi:DNA-binding transcriptional regulator YiaG